MADLELRPTIFLDTNALHCISSYLQHAKRNALPPYQEGKDYEQVRETLRQNLPKSIADMVMRGAQALAFLQRLVQDRDAAIYTSRFAKAEVIYGTLEGQAHARLAREGLSYRMRQRAGTLSELVCMYLDPEDYEQVIQEWDKLLDCLEKRDRVIISYAEDDADFSQIADIAGFLQSRIFMDVLDSWMYGCASVVQAEKIITFDRYFRKVINKIHNPQEDEVWQQVQAAMIEKLNQLFPVETPIKPSLSKAPRRLPNQVPHSWRENYA